MATSEVLITVESISKKFCKDLKTSMKYGVIDLVREFSGQSVKPTLRPKEFWSVQDVNFQLKRGQCLGLIGHNGAGKSTLLKMLNGLIKPDKGRIEMRGRTGALIELGAGFNPLLTGRENIYNNGAILGFSKAEIKSKIDAIIAFSEIEAYIDMAVQHYSSGMRVRLGFSVAAQMEPDILLIDEVLAVGDMGFKMKSLNAIEDLLPKTAIIFVSHSMPMISRLCTDILLLDTGKVVFQSSDVSEGIDRYFAGFQGQESREVSIAEAAVELLELVVYEPDKEQSQEVSTIGSEMGIYLRYKIHSKYVDAKPSLLIQTQSSTNIASVHFPEHSECATITPIGENRLEVAFRVIVHNIHLTKGAYSGKLVIYGSGSAFAIYKKTQAIHFYVRGIHSRNTPFEFVAERLD